MATSRRVKVKAKATPRKAARSRRRPVSPPAGRVVGLGGVFFKTPDKGRATAFYRSLGLPLGEDGYCTWTWGPPGGRRGVAGHTVFSLFPADTGYFGRGPQPFMVNLRVEGLDALLARLRGAGVQVDPEIQQESYGRFAWIVDPDGHRVELWEPSREAGFAGEPMR